MRVEQCTYSPASGWSGAADMQTGNALILVFGGVDLIARPDTFSMLRDRYPSGILILVSTAGEIAGDQVRDESLVCTAISFDATPFRVLSADAASFANSRDCGLFIGTELSDDRLRHILLLSEGTLTNGDQLVGGLKETTPSQVLITGGLAADAGRFEQTYVGIDEPARPGRIAAIGFYGDQLEVAHGSRGGWDPFGPLRRVSRSSGNVLHELDGTNALDLYKTYLGERAAELPGSALLFPLCIVDGENLVVRTILNIDEESGSMTFAGDIPQGARVQFMMANFDRLIDGAAGAAEDTARRLRQQEPDLVLMVSCVGRKIVLGPRIDEEVESVVEVFGTHPVYCGFYSNGEISPVVEGVGCSLHNQTMTITTYRENIGV